MELFSLNGLCLATLLLYVCVGEVNSSGGDTAYLRLIGEAGASKRASGDSKPLNLNKEQMKAVFTKHAQSRGKANTMNEIEFGEMMVELMGPTEFTERQIQMMFDSISGNDDECSFHEFWNGITTMSAKPDQLDDIFKQYDTDGSGMLTKDELTKAMMKSQQNFSDEMLQQLLDCADFNKDGKISKEEFRNNKCPS